ncbi:MAG TPA: hypothetical protein VJR92_15675 [Gemmatimonadaceae bacterium]|nr:hypothetical protein [Gemmatimonadaceae bacterium]
MASFVRNAVLILAALATTAGAQSARTANGVVRRPDGVSTQPVTGAWVVLHRVGRDGAGPVDSVRSDARGGYAFRFGAGRDSSAFFASTAYLGVTYFTPPFAGASTRGDDAAINVYDTTSVAAPVRTRGRHVIVFGGDSAGLRQIAEVFWLENATQRTRVPLQEKPSWSSLLPDGATNVHVEQGDVAPTAVQSSAGRVSVYAPIAPGLRQLHISYTVPVSRFPLTFPVGDTTTVLEVLIEGLTGGASGASLETQQGTVVDERAFQRFLARDVASGATFVVTLPAQTAGLKTWYVAGVVGLAALALIFAFARSTGMMRTRATIPNRALRPTPARAESIAASIASLDARFARHAAPTDAERASYEQQRVQLKAELTDVLAQRDDQL